jgi:DNA polymerase-3 subunit alpha
MDLLKKYLNVNKISFKLINDDIFEINNSLYQLIKPNEEGVVFDEGFNLIVNQKKTNLFIFYFGDKYYYTDSVLNPQLNILKYIGKSNSDILTSSFLGVRGCFEILNGSRLYKDWCKKASFLGIKTLGICEKNTLAGVLKFQLECKKWGIKPIIGATYTIFDEKNDYRFDIKCYVQNETGWRNLLLINKEVNVTNTRFIAKDVFLTLREGLFLIADPKSIEYTKLDFNVDFYQLDTVEFEDNNRESWYLENLKKFFESKIESVSITDAFYLDKEDNHIKEKLNTIGGFHEYQSKNQYFKDKEDYFTELSELFGETDERLYDVFTKAVENEEYICGICDFKIETGKKHLPKYKMTLVEKERFENTNNMFWSLVEDGLSRYSNGDIESEVKRIEEEIDIINHGHLQDYFLINWEQTKFCKENNYLQGIGRGSSSGFLVTRLLDITKIHPFDYNLIAERFLTRERAKNSIADIDCDYCQEDRDKVKQHLIDKYGKDQCCSVGTYTTMQLKGAFKDLARGHSVDFGLANIISNMLTECETITDIFKKASERPELKRFINSHSNIFNDLSEILESRKSRSIHASAFIITPDDKKVWEWMPVRKEYKENEEMLVSEWEGYDLEAVGFLKQDILGIKQLDKIKGIVNYIKENTGNEIDIYNLPLDDKKVYKYLSNGWNKDVFQFGTSGLSQYCTQLKPENINDLIAAVALYRPGTMGNNFHNEYILRKEGKRAVDYFYGTEDILKDTYGLMCYQEDTMLICQKLGNFNLAETDLIRKYLGKKDKEKLPTFKKRFVDGAISNGCPEKEAVDIWDAMEKFAGYGFNKSHAAAYAITGYISQWLKVNYPIEFWTVALSFASDDDVAGYISEIHKTGDIVIMPPSINISDTNTKTDFAKNTIYWALSSIKQVGETSTNQIMQDRESNGQYFLFEEFLDRNLFKSSKVNKRTVENLVICGVFDELDNIKQPKDRIQLIEFYRDKYKVKADESDLFNVNRNKLDCNWWWILQQKQLSGIAFFDFPLLYKTYISSKTTYEYCDYIEFCEDKSAKDRKKACIAGYIHSCEIKSTSKGDIARIVLDNNYDFMDVTVWSEQYEDIKDGLGYEPEGKLMLITGNVVQYRGKAGLNTNNDTQIVILE